MVWEIAHNIESLLAKNKTNAGAQFDLTINDNEEKSNAVLAECVQGL